MSAALNATPIKIEIISFTISPSLSNAFFFSSPASNSMARFFFFFAVELNE